MKLTIGLWLVIFAVIEIIIGVILQETFWFECAKITALVSLVFIIFEGVRK